MHTLPVDVVWDGYLSNLPALRENDVVKCHLSGRAAVACLRAFAKGKHQKTRNIWNCWSVTKKKTTVQLRMLCNCQNTAAVFCTAINASSFFKTSLLLVSACHGGFNNLIRLLLYTSYSTLAVEFTGESRPEDRVYLLILCFCDV